MGLKTYKIKYTDSSRFDMKEMKKYILNTFKYRELGENFTKKMKEAVAGLKVLPAGFDTIGLRYRGYDIYLKPYKSYLFFYVVSEESETVTILRVLQDGMNWEFILENWLRNNQ